MIRIRGKIYNCFVTGTIPSIRTNDGHVGKGYPGLTRPVPIRYAVYDKYAERRIAEPKQELKELESVK